ncbi:MAG: ATP-binding protein, partial [Ignavibacteria bacterium]|nr:ATP-binding protein [Ignavibacteria bacterium]
KDRNTREEIRKDLNELRRNLLAENVLPEELEKWIILIRKTEAAYLLQPSNIKEGDKTTPRMTRLKYILKDVLKQKDIDEENNNSLPFEKISELVEARFKEAFGKIKSRPTSLFIEALKNVFTEGELPSKFEILEFDDLIVSIDKNNLSIPYSIQNAIYIDTPMMIGVETSDNEHWDDLNELLQKKGKTSFSSLSQTISKEILNGEVSVDDNSLTINDFSFKRPDGSIYNLLDCATGVKSFAILQLLLKNGSLSDKTLLIIDEPESHLHPQWIIEYARVIVLLNKEIGIKFFIASHNPDMVSAIRYISEKEEVLENLNFYLAKKIGDKYLYDYNHLAQEIEPIFESFNKAIDGINKYGV